MDHELNNVLKSRQPTTDKYKQESAREFKVLIDRLDVMINKLEIG